MPIRNRFSELLPEITAWRRDFHENPEILYETHRTSGIVAEKLRDFGCDEVVEGIGRTGVVGVIKGKADTAGRVVALRADMDALPIPEETGLPHASKTPGAMHACGHDGHTAMLLGAAKYLAETRNFDGTLVVVFQPAEEGGAGGEAMVKDGLMDRWGIQEIYGMHNWPGMSEGAFAIRPGAFFAATDTFDIKVQGVGGHAAKPQSTRDPVVGAAQLVSALQTIVSRSSDPTLQLVVSVTSMVTSSTAYNVIPQNVEIRGTVRTMDAGIRDLAEARMGEICAGLGAAMGLEIAFDYTRSYPVMANHETETLHAIEAAKRVSGDCADAPLVMGGEDFAYMLEARPGAYILVGNGETASVHHPKYDFTDEIIPVGCSYWAELTETRMPLSGA
ncbi:MAG: M20 aminoacylase family protein [Pseudomonadota bacterium]